MSSISNGLDHVVQPQEANGDPDLVELPLWFEVPTGFFALPLTDPAEAVQQAQDVLLELATAEQQAVVPAVLGALGELLEDLAARQSVYCGLGHHVSGVDGAEVSSTLVVSVQRTGGTGDPRMLLGEMVRRRGEQDWQGQADLLDLLGRPVLFSESVRELPEPVLPGAAGGDQDATAAVFSLEALVPSPDGSLLACVDFATPFVGNGPEFRMMMVSIAASLSFEPPEQSDRPDQGGQGASVPTSSIRAALG
ncbi:hypothetical protein ACEZCY_30590 [Streptacidiphilus sp. N1-12]|uniref:Uncharacterized protein n=2 Tax=Streptacidiphilus alkalitolerans TaxID=3342712 RepID=A0ABV6VI58_9ACTN